MKRVLFLGIVICLLFQANAFCLDRPFGTHSNGTTAAQSLLFLEMWNNVAFYDTNLEKQRFASVLGRFEGKVGFNLFHYPIQTYVAYYGVASQSEDYWDNNVYSGGGVRLLPFRDFQGTSWANEWIKGVKIFYEGLGSSYFKNKVSAEALADTDTRYGIEIWHEWNLAEPNFGAPWGELWLKYAFHQTNFGWEPFESWVVYFQPKLGIFLSKEIQAYLKTDITYSGMGGASYSFLNIADYGVGVRFVPWQTIGKSEDLLKNFRMFAEILGVSYLDVPPTNPVNNVSSDVRFGVEFSYGR